MPSHEKKSAAELRAELRALRKETLKPISRMRTGDISAEIERLRGNREETPAVAAVPSAPPRKSQPSTTTLREAKRYEFPVAPSSEKTKATRAAPKMPAAAATGPPKKKESKLAKLMKMMESMSDTEEE